MKLSNQSVIVSIEVLSITFLGHRYFPTIYVIFTSNKVTFCLFHFVVVVVISL